MQSTFKIDISKVPLLFRISYSLVPKIEICIKYFSDKNSQNQPLWMPGRAAFPSRYQLLFQQAGTRHQTPQILLLLHQLNTSILFKCLTRLSSNSLLVHHYGLKFEPSPTKNAIEREKKSSSLQAFKKSRKEKVKYIKKCKKKRITEKTNYGKIVLAIFNHNFKRPKKNLFGSI